MKRLGQQSRLVVLLLNLVFLLSISRIVFNSWLPPTSEKGVWFYAGLASLLIGYLLSNPYFPTPKDVFSYSISALISIIALGTIQDGTHKGFDYFLWVSILGYSIFILVTSMVAIFSKDLKSNMGEKVKSISYLISSRLGDSKVIFSLLYWFALVVFHRSSLREYLVLSIAWAVVVAIPVLETLVDLLIRLQEIVRQKITGQVNLVGQIVGYQFPNILLIKHDDYEKINFGTPLIVHGDDGKFGVGIALDYIGYADGRWLRAYKLFSDIRPDALNFPSSQQELGAYKLEIENPDDFLSQNEIWRRRANFIGIVAPDTDSSKLKMDVANSGKEIEVGRLIEVRANGESVLYQIINGSTKEEVILQKNTRGYVRADARKIGTWNDDKGNFEVAKWVPQPNSPIFLVDNKPAKMVKDAVGFFPGTDYPAKIADVDKLVTHNTAILGILGIGKSFLAFELLERMLEHGVKVICLDITNQYVAYLGNYQDTEKEKVKIDWLKKHGPDGKTNFQRNKEEGGSVIQFRSALLTMFTKILAPNNETKFLTLNPAEFEVWRQEGNVFKDTDRPPMASLTPVEITKLITEVALEVLQGQGITDAARCCLVFEEAHSLIPEWNSVINDGDKSATNGIAKSILQGRKYGLGCLVITQRTANVTKSVLNQCNTIFAMRLFDSTGMEFLRNYIGTDYSNVLSTLEDRHAVFFGRASSCKDPVLIKLNERKDFLKAFREPPDTLI